MASVSRSRIDPVSNAVVLSADELTQHFEDFLVPGHQPPLSVLPSLLHEATHHWCFHSAVGTTLALMQLRARLAAYKLTAEADQFLGARSSALKRTTLALMRLRARLAGYKLTSEADQFLVGRSSALKRTAHAMDEDFARSSFTLALLRPLTEGLAQLAEFDVVPGKSPVLSGPMRYAMHLYQVPGLVDLDRTSRTPTSSEADVIRTVSARISALLTRVRVSVSTRRRLEHLLVQPLDNDPEGYLAGYLSVQNLWAAAARSDDRFNDSDLFLSFARRYFYGDMGLVALLLDPATSGEGSVEAIANHYRERLLRFLEGAPSGEVERFEQEESAKREVNDYVRRWVDPEPALWQQGEERAMALLREFTEGSTGALPESLEGAIRYVYGKLVQGRDLLAIGSVPVEVVVRGGEVRALSGGETMFACPALPSVGDWTGLGTAEVYVSTVLKCRAGVICAATGPLGLITTPEIPAEQRAAIVEQVGLRRAVDLEKSAWREAQDHWLWRYILLEDQPIWVQTVLPDVLERIYVDLATLKVPEDGAEGIQLAMRENGFWTLLDQDPEVVRGLALLCLCNAPALVRAGIEKVFAEQGIDLSRVVDRLTAIADETRMLRIRKSEWLIQCSL